MNKQETHHPDFKLFCAFCKQDKKACKKIYDDFFPKIKQMVTSNNGSISEAWDIFQEGLIVLMRYCKREEFVLKVPLYYFLSSICYKLWLKELGKKKKSWITFSDLPEYIDIGSNVRFQEEEILNTERLKILLDHLEDLPDKARQTLTLFYLEGKSLREIAVIVGFANETSAKVQKFKYLCKLRALALGDKDFD